MNICEWCAVHRFGYHNTTVHCHTLLSIINDPNWEVSLYARNYDLDDNNSPLLSALAAKRVGSSCLAEVVIVFDDKCFLTAARLPRESEVRAVFDAASEHRDRVYICKKPVEDTHQLNAQKASECLMKHDVVRCSDDSLTAIKRLMRMPS